jgi:hypothetical protein
MASVWIPTDVGMTRTFATVGCTQYGGVSVHQLYDCSVFCKVAFNPFVMTMTPPSSQRSRNFSIEQLPGLNRENGQKLIAAGIQTTHQLLRCTHTQHQQQQLANQLHIHTQHIQKWAALANLSQVPSVGCQYCGLLLHAGIATPQQLAIASLPRLHRQVLKLHIATMHTKQHCPSLEQVSTWIQDAQKLGQ